MESDHEISRYIHDEWVIDVNNDLGEGRLDGNDGGSVGMPPIFRVPEKLRVKNEKAYQPEVVSIGPYHKGSLDWTMEKHKRRALLHFLRRSNQNPEMCLDHLRGHLQEIMAAYDILSYGKDDEEEFLKLMLVDGCFILEILLTYSGIVEDYDKDDTIFGRRGQFYNVPSIRRDLLLIENQIPLLVLQELFVFSVTKMELRVNGLVEGLIGILLEFFSVKVGRFERIFGGDDLKQRLHILELYRQILIIDDEDEGSGFKLKKLNEYKIPSAMALQDHGILMRRHSGPARFSRRDQLWTLLTANFGGGELKLPGLTVDDATESVFLNAMVFEAQRPEADARVTSYVHLMSDLMVSPKDAGLLSTELGIISNELGSDQALVDLFRKLSSANFLPDIRFFFLEMSINMYCDRRRNRFKAYVNRTYFRNPWALISVFYAIILFLLTAIQAFYAVYPYYSNNKRNT